MGQGARDAVRGPAGLGQDWPLPPAGAQAAISVAGPGLATGRPTGCAGAWGDPWPAAQRDVCQLRAWPCARPLCTQLCLTRPFIHGAGEP